MTHRDVEAATFAEMIGVTHLHLLGHVIGPVAAEPPPIMKIPVVQGPHVPQVQGMIAASEGVGGGGKPLATVVPEIP